jgi:cell wall-associated NlpC family hydrolase
MPLVQEQLSVAKGEASTRTELDPNTPDLVRQIIRNGERQIGVPYAWAGGTCNCNGPSAGSQQGAGTIGFDCSHFVYYCYCSAGLGNSIGGYNDTYNYWNNGRGRGLLTPTTRDTIRPADMLFFANFDHMALAVGPDEMLEAPHTGAYIRYAPIRQDFCGALTLPVLWGPH